MWALWGGGWWVSTGDSDVRARPRSGRPCTAVSSRNQEFQSVHQRKSEDNYQGTLYGAEHQIQRVGNEVGNVGISESLCQVESHGYQWQGHGTVEKFGWTVLPHPPHSPDLAPSDFHQADETWTKSKSKVKLSRNRPWKPMGLWDVKDPTLSRQSVHRWRQGCQPYAPAALYSPETLLF
jgi:hypothetical protein